MQGGNGGCQSVDGRRHLAKLRLFGGKALFNLGNARHFSIVDFQKRLYLRVGAGGQRSQNLLFLFALRCDLIQIINGRVQACGSG